MRLCESRLNSILAIEADALSFAKLQSFLKELSLNLPGRISARCCTVGSQAGVVCFECYGSVYAKIGDNSTTEVECFRLDDLLQEKEPTNIKMDIEGAEYDSLLGAEQTISKCRPILAICVYHLQSDVWRIPLFIRKFVPDDNLFLRMYEGDGWQTVVYAVPPERSLSTNS